MDPFDDPDITIRTNDSDANWAVWEMAHAEERDGQTSFEIAEKMQKALTPERIHEIWIIVNDALVSGGLLYGLYKAFKGLEPKEGRNISIRFGARLRVSRDDRERLETLGIDLAFDRDETKDQNMSRVERQFQLWAGQNVHTIPGLSEADAFDAEVARLREKVERDLAELIPQIEEELGDLDDLIRATYESIHDPELGFKDGHDD